MLTRITVVLLGVSLTISSSARANHLARAMPHYQHTFDAFQSALGARHFLSRALKKRLVIMKAMNGITDTDTVLTAGTTDPYDTERWGTTSLLANHNNTHHKEPHTTHQRRPLGEILYFHLSFLSRTIHLRRTQRRLHVFWWWW